MHFLTKKCEYFVNNITSLVFLQRFCNSIWKSDKLPYDVYNQILYIETFITMLSISSYEWSSSWHWDHVSAFSLSVHVHKSKNGLVYVYERIVSHEQTRDEAKH